MMKKRILCMMVCVVMMIGILPAVTASAVVSGKCGDNLTWTLDDGGRLTIFGTGDMWDWDIWLEVPWYAEKNSVERVVISSGVTSIGECAFFKCINLMDITIPDSVTSIGESAFFECKNLQSVIIADSVVTIGRQCFYGNDNLIDIVIPYVHDFLGELFAKVDSYTEGVTTHYDGYYISGSYLVKGYYMIPPTLKKIVLTNQEELGNGAFSNCNYIEELTINRECSQIGDIALYGCENLKKLSIPFVGKTRTASGSSSAVFGYLFGTSNSSMCYEANQVYSSAGNVSYNIPVSLKEVEITGATQIPYGAFSGCQGIEYIELNEGITEIGQKAFADCGFLSVHIPASVTRIGSNAFSGTDVEKLYVSLNSYGHKYAEENGYPYEIYDYYPVTGVTLNKNKLDIVEGNAYTLTATVAPENATYKNVIWSSSDEDIATVDENGVVTAVSKGVATINATTEENKFKSTCVVNVLRPVSSVKLNYSTLNIGVGYTKTLIATVYPKTASNKDIIWSTDNSEIATVSNGIVTSVGYGTTKIRATTVDGGYIAECVINSTIPVNGISLNKTSAELLVGDAVSLVATVTPTDAFDKTVNWSSSNTTVATVENGKVTAKSAGNAVITAKTNDGGKTASCVVTVKEPIVNVKDITLNKCDIALNAGESETLVATLSPTNATNKKVTWISSDESIATVDKNGKVTAKANGIAIITVTTEEGNKEATCTVTVSGGINSDIVIGDANGDGEVDFADAIVVLKHDAGVTALSGDKLEAADTNGDGEVDFVDAIQILKFDSGLISSFK